MKWAQACFLVLLVGTARAQVCDACSLRDVSARWAEYYSAAYHVPVELVAAIIDEVPKHITREPLASVLVVGDFSRSTFTKETVEHLKIAAVFDRPHLKKAAWVFTENLNETLLESIRTFSAREIPTFRTREEALEYLVTE